MLFFNKKYIQLIETSIKIEKHLNKDKPLPFTSLTAGARSMARVF